MILLRRYAVILLVMLIAAAIAYGSNQSDFEKGNDLYTKGEYAKAAEVYQKILQSGYHSSELYYNLGNACFRQGQLGMAILYYTRAEQLDPRDDDIRANLLFARQFAVDKVEITEETILLDYINRFFSYFSLNEITWLTVLFYILSAAAILVHYIYRRIYIPGAVITVLLGIFAIAAVFTAVKLNRDVLTHTGVVINQQAEVRNGPGDDFKSQFTAHAGLTFKIEREEDGYYLVNLENRVKGWIAKSSVAEI